MLNLLKTIFVQLVHMRRSKEFWEIFPIRILTKGTTVNCFAFCVYTFINSSTGIDISTSFISSSLPSSSSSSLSLSSSSLSRSHLDLHLQYHHYPNSWLLRSLLQPTRLVSVLGVVPYTFIHVYYIYMLTAGVLSYKGMHVYM